MAIRATVYNNYSRPAGYIDLEEMLVYDADGVKCGSLNLIELSPITIRDKYGSRIGTGDFEGNIYDVSGNRVGRVNTYRNKIYDAESVMVGQVDYLDHEVKSLMSDLS